MQYQIYALEESFKIKELITVYHRTFETDYHYKGEVHNFWELVYVIEGKVSITADRYIYELESNQVVFHKPGEFHGIWSSGTIKPQVFIITFNFNKGMKELENFIGKVGKKANNLIELLIEETKGLSTKFNIEKETSQLVWVDGKELAVEQAIKNYLELFIIEVLRQIDVEGHQSIARSMGEEGSKIYEEVVSYIHTNLFTSLDVQNICDCCNVSRSTLKKIFKKYVGIGIMEYVNQMKMNKAMQLLEEGLTVREVAETLAFSSQHYFAYAFKNLVGMTPSEYKNTYLTQLLKEKREQLEQK